MEERISVVIPVYNAASRLSVCLDSLLSQTYPHLEIILVDDGSTDDSLSLCRAYAQKDHRICVIHQENQGVSAARNVGIRQATGKYLAFIDADDYVKPDYFQRLAQAAVEHGADIVCCDYIEILEGDARPEYAPKVEKTRLITDHREIFASIGASRESYWSCVWGKLIRTELAKSAAFSLDLKYGEDQVYMYDLLVKKPVIYLDTYQGYYYIRNESSATVRVSDFHLKRRLDEMRMSKYRLTHLPEYAAGEAPGLQKLYADSIQRAVLALAVSGTKEDRCKHSKILRPEIKKLSLSAFSPKGRAHILLYLLCPESYSGFMRRRFG